jgi:hypothetical protein
MDRMTLHNYRSLVGGDHANYCTAVIQRTAFHMHTTRITEDDVEVKEPSKTFAVSALRHSMANQVLFLYLHTVPGSRPDLG